MINHALRFRIWQYANPRGWDVTFAEVAAALDVSPKAIGAVAKHAGWIERFRVADRHTKLHAFGVNASAFYRDQYLAADVAAGRVSYDSTAL